jgi:hypothetical protein
VSGAEEAAELVLAGPGTWLLAAALARGEGVASLARTCAARVAAWYLVPLTVTTNCGLAPRKPPAAADVPDAEPAGAAGAATAELSPEEEAADEDEYVAPLVRDIPYPMPAITTRPAITEVTALSGIERNTWWPLAPPRCRRTRARAGGVPSVRPLSAVAPAVEDIPPSAAAVSARAPSPARTAASAASAVLIRDMTASGITGAGTDAR